MIRTLVDVDGVVADLMGGFSRFMAEHADVDLDVSKITRHRIDESPELSGIDMMYGLDSCLTTFLGLKDVYQTYVSPIDGAKEAFVELQSMTEVVFVTAILKTAPQSYESKFRWCREHFGDAPFLAIPSTMKHGYFGVIGIDDRYDICERYRKAGLKAFLFKQPWNEAPADAVGHDWRSIVDGVDSMVRRWNE